MDGCAIVRMYPFECTRYTPHGNVGNGRRIRIVGENVDALQGIKPGLIPWDRWRVGGDGGGGRVSPTLFRRASLSVCLPMSSEATRGSFVSTTTPSDLPEYQCSC